jgi:galactonate dehydratase
MGGVVMAAISGIDTTLYDIVGKKLGVPVYNLLGGKLRESLRIYANGWAEGVPRLPEALASRTKELVSKGFTGCKSKRRRRPRMSRLWPKCSAR